MEANLKFNLPDDKNEFILATKGADYWNCLWDIEQTLRQYDKNGFPDRIGTKEDLCEDIRNMISANINIFEVE